MDSEGRAHPDCVNASNPYHECVEFCFRRIAETKERIERERVEKSETEIKEGGGSGSLDAFDQSGDADKQGNEIKEDAEGNEDQRDDKYIEADYANLNAKQKKLFELRLKLNEARKANRIAITVENNKLDPPSESRGISKQKWIEERKKKIGKLLDANGLDMTKAFMLDTQEMAESKYKKWEKDPAPSGWDVFNQKTLYNAYKKRTKNVQCDLEEYNKLKEADPEFYRNASSLQYGKAPKASGEKIDKMVKELQDREEKRGSFSRRRKFHDEKDIDSINDRNEHFNKKIERAFGKYTLEIKNNLERGTALPD